MPNTLEIISHLLRILDHLEKNRWIAVVLTRMFTRFPVGKPEVLSTRSFVRSAGMLDSSWSSAAMSVRTETKSSRNTFTFVSFLTPCLKELEDLKPRKLFLKARARARRRACQLLFVRFHRTLGDPLPRGKLSKTQRTLRNRPKFRRNIHWRPQAHVEENVCELRYPNS